MQYKVQEIEDYGVVISEDEIKIGDIVYNNDADIFPISEEDDIHYVNNTYYKVIATIGKDMREQGIRLIVMPDEDVWKIGNKLKVTTICDFKTTRPDVNYGKQVYKGIVIERDKGLCLDTDEGKFNTQGTYWFGSILRQKVELIEAAPSKGTFSEEDMRRCWEVAGKKATAWLDTDTDEKTPDLEQYLKSLQKKKLPKAVVLEMELYVDDEMRQQERIKINPDYTITEVKFIWIL